MLKYYLLTAWQHIARQKLFALINVLGLAIGLAVFILVFLYVKKEYSWDRHWDNADQLHWLTYEYQVNSTVSFQNIYAPYPAMAMIRENFPEVIEKSARMLYRGNFIHVGENRFQDNIVLVDREFTEILALEVINGSLEDALEQPGRIALREDSAERFFGVENPLGKTISLETAGQELVDYHVAAVFRVPEETSVGISSFGLLEETALPDLAERLGNWTTGPRSVNLVRLVPGADIEAINRRLVGLTDSIVPKEPWRVLQPGDKLSDFHRYEIQPLKDAHFDENLDAPNQSNKTRVDIFALIGIVVLVMGSANFVILATAKADDRKKEVGIRKVLGAKKSQLMIQFLGESVLYVLVAVVLAVVLVNFTLPFFGSMVDQELAFDMLDPKTVFLLFLLVLVVGILGGLYPAFVLTGVDTVSIVKPRDTKLAGVKFNVRTVLTCFQFSIAIALIIATMVLYFQLNFVRNLELGFVTDNLFVLQLRNDEVRDNAVALINELQGLPGAVQIARSTRQPISGGFGMFTAGKYVREQVNLEAEFQGYWVDGEFFDVYGMTLLAGRFFDSSLDIARENAPESESGARRSARRIVNRHLTESLGFVSPEDAVGQLVYLEVNGPNGESRRVPQEIIGVVEDNRFLSLDDPVINEVYLLGENNPTTLTIKYEDSAENSIQREAERIWKEVMVDNTFFGHFVEQSLIESFAQEENEGRLMLTFSALTVFIAALGLYGIAAYAIKKGVKEIGIRKVLGATSRQVLLLFLWRFSVPVLVANVIAWPVAIYAMLRWLQRFNEQIDYVLLVPICLFATLLAMLFAWATVGLTTARAARANPVKSLRYE